MSTNKTVLMAWELGGGLGHLSPLAVLGRELLKRGHRVLLAARDLSRVESVFAESGVRWLQAPVKTAVSPDRIDPPRTFAHILYNSGYADSSELSGMVAAWCALYDLTGADAVVCDHAPTALVAGRVRGLRRVVIGNGFTCPPDAESFPDLRPWLPAAADRLRRDEQRVLASVNAVLQRGGSEPLERLGQLYGGVEATILRTRKELDPYSSRVGARYFGAWPCGGRAVPRWPDAAGPKIFVYLASFPTLPTVLSALRDLGWPTLAYLRSPDAGIRSQFDGPTLRLSSEPLDVGLAAAQCDLAVLNGGHGVTATMLAAGKPVLNIPLSLEQSLTSMAVVRLGAGVACRPDRPWEILPALRRTGSEAGLAHAARQFAARYAGYDPHRTLADVVDQIESCLSPPDVQVE